MATVTNNQRSGNQNYSGTARNLVPGKVKRIILDGSTQEAAEWGGYDAVGLIYFTKIKQKNASKEKTTNNEKKAEGNKTEGEGNKEMLDTMKTISTLLMQLNSTMQGPLIVTPTNKKFQ